MNYINVKNDFIFKLVFESDRVIVLYADVNKYQSGCHRPLLNVLIYADVSIKVLSPYRHSNITTYKPCNRKRLPQHSREHVEHFSLCFEIGHSKRYKLACASN